MGTYLTYISTQFYFDLPIKKYIYQHKCTLQYCRYSLVEIWYSMKQTTRGNSSFTTFINNNTGKLTNLIEECINYARSMLDACINYARSMLDAAKTMFLKKNCREKYTLLLRKSVYI